MNTVELLLHPVRLRIVHAFAGQLNLTIAELGGRLPDVPRTTLYRHVGLLADACVLEVTSERRVHGGVERTYRLNRTRTRITPGEAAAMTRDDHRSAFAAAVAALLADFNAYLDQPDADPVADMVGYLQVPLWLSRDELASMLENERAVLAERARNERAPGRRAYVLSPILFPLRDRPE